MLDYEIKNGFGSDNHSGVHPQIMQAIVDCNHGHLPSYGTDPICKKAHELFEKIFETDLASYFVFNGTASNTLALKAMTSGFHSVFCSDVAHINVDECGAPEAIAHCKLIPLPSKHGKISLSQVEEKLQRLGDQHSAQPKVISLTQPTELGTLYSMNEIKEFCDFAHRKGLYVHIDGARAANAVVSANLSFAEMFSQTGVDVLSLGGTKNGFLFGEAVLFFDRSLASHFKYIRKQGLNLPSKSRFIAAQFVEYFKSDLWRQISEQSNKMASELEQLIKDIPGVEITHPVQSNSVFAKIPRPWVKKVRKDYFFYVWDEKTFETRLMCSFDTSFDDLQGLASALKQASLELG